MDLPHNVVQHRRFPVFELIVWLLLACAIGYQLLIPPIIGMADNGDYWRTMHSAGLDHPTQLSFSERYFNYVHTDFVLRDIDQIRWITSEAIFVYLARGIHAVFVHSDHFDLRLLGGVHAIALLGVIALSLLAFSRLHWLPRVCGAGLLLLIFSDAGYVQYLNSFFTEPASLFFLLLLLAGMLLLGMADEWKAIDARWLVVLCLIGLFGFLTAKVQNAVLVLPLAWLAYRVITVGWPALPSSRRRVVWSGLACVLLMVMLAAAFYAIGIPERARRMGVYNAFFYGVLLHSKDPAVDVRAFGLDPSLAQYAGTVVNDYERGGLDLDDPILERTFFATMNHRRILLFYLFRPARWSELLNRGSANAFRFHIPELGNYTAESGYPPRTHATQFRVWHNLLWQSCLNHWWCLLAVLGLGATLGIARYRLLDRTRYARLSTEFWGVLMLMALMQLVIVPLGDGDQDVWKHLFLFNLLFDVLVIGMALMAGELVMHASRRILPPRVARSDIDSRIIGTDEQFVRM
jgi:hypothetical protein